MVKENVMQNTEIGLLPEEWDLKKLGNIAFVTKLAGFEYSKYFNSYKDGGEIVVIRGTNITSNKLDLSDTKYIPRKTSDFLHRSKLSKGDLVFAYVGTIGPIYLVKENNRFHLGPNTAKIKIENRDVDVDYIFNYFLSEFIRKEIEDRMSIGAQPSLSMAKIRDFNIPLPPLPEQEAIAEALSDTDEWIESLEKLIAKKRLIKQGAMQELLTSKEGWEKKRLGELLLRNPEYGINAAAVKYQDKLPTYLRITDISENGTFLQDGKVSVDHFLSVNYMLDAGDVCIARTGASVGKSYYHKKENGNLVFAGFLIRLKVNPQLLNSKLLFYITKSQSYQDYINSNSLRSGQPGINSLELQSYEFFIPNSLTEQTRIANILSDMDAELEALAAQLKKVRKIKQGMMQELLTGRIRLV
ncbi:MULTISPECIES: restriction endonuclease subunit S [Sphingobacterium]|uniref:restriction endonuclease subunit S n=1 Tax=Sphingobacterium TaxID=28453 RepID=UPI00257F8EFD|nr:MULTISPECIES: restriction endonuclease subunit S [Sphingobacterium]